MVGWRWVVGWGYRKEGQVPSKVGVGGSLVRCVPTPRKVPAAYSVVTPDPNSKIKPIYLTQSVFSSSAEGAARLRAMSTASQKKVARNQPGANVRARVEEDMRIAQALREVRE